MKTALRRPRVARSLLLALALSGVVACGGSGGGDAGGTSGEGKSGAGAGEGGDTSAGSGASDAAPKPSTPPRPRPTHPVPFPGDYKVARVPMTTNGPRSLDPVQGSTQYDNRCCSLVYQTLLQYRYLVRPERITDPLEVLEPLLCREMPTISDDGKTWTFRLRDDVYFHDDPCFPGGKGRKLVAEDVVYSWKRHVDPQYEYENYWLLENSIVGLDAYKKAERERVDAGKPFDYAVPVEGLRAVDDTTLVIKLTEPVQAFPWKLAMFQLSVVAREAVEKYGAAISGHPVGTGPFRLEREEDWKRNISLRLVKNPNYFDERFPEAYDDWDREHGIDRYAGQRLPLLDEVQITFFVEDQTGWLEFGAKRLDYTTVPEFGFDEAFKKVDRTLKSSYLVQGIESYPLPLLDFIFRAFNMDDGLLGGYSDKKKALRQAICYALDWQEMNEAYYWGTAIVYDGMIPPGLDGYPKDGKGPVSTNDNNLELARKKLREAGYKVGADGKVTDLPTLDFYTSRGATSEKHVALIQRNLERIGVKLNPRLLDFSELIEAIDNKKAPFFSFAWGTDYPDAENNLAIFYGPNESPGSNHFNYKRKDYDALYEQIRLMPPGHERTQILERMRDMVIDDAAFAGSLARTRYYLIEPWLVNFKPSETFYNYMKYWDVDMSDPRRKE